MEIGFVGTGTIAAAMVRGLQTVGARPLTLVSPRSETTSRELAAQYERVRRTASNAEAASADIVVLGTRPAQVMEALAGLTFRPGQIVVSLVAGMKLAEVQRLAPAARVDRVVPLPGIARGQGPISIFPGQPEIVELLRPLGDLIVVKSEDGLSMGGLSAFMSSYFELQAALVATVVSAGVSPVDARLYVTSLLSMLADTSRQTPDDRFAALAAEHETKGGLNERVRGLLREAGWFTAPGEAAAKVNQLGWKALG